MIKLENEYDPKRIDPKHMAGREILIRDKEQCPDIIVFQSNIKYFTTIYNNMFPNNNNNNNKIFKKHTHKQTQLHKKTYINKSLKKM